MADRFRRDYEEYRLRDRAGEIQTIIRIGYRSRAGHAFAEGCGVSGRRARTLFQLFKSARPPPATPFRPDPVPAPLRDWFNSVRRVVREHHGMPST